ncbi:hypothetical protein PR048_022926 [Dryococelus australis]|uniref:Uncharacterized protein n=1 Tax=Dryococelus australis TaxID=614101 RepID=A0ABQ9GSM0_9NEOP|nr:hypothetical protein PR048_022926 [Dryococelus australis]
MEEARAVGQTGSRLLKNSAKDRGPCCGRQRIPLRHRKRPHTYKRSRMFLAAHHSKLLPGLTSKRLSSRSPTLAATCYSPSHQLPVTRGGWAISLLASYNGEPGSIPGQELCRTMLLIGWFSRGSPVFPALSFRRCSILTSITLIGSQDLAVKSRQNLFTHSRLLQENGSSFRLLRATCPVSNALAVDETFTRHKRNREQTILSTPNKCSAKTYDSRAQRSYTGVILVYSERNAEQDRTY